ncbi:MAG: SRPBCC family protein [Gemmataceae bacterium]
MGLVNAPVVRTHMLIRRPVAEVFEAFLDPAITSRFWFSRGSDRLSPAAEVIWYWDMYGVSVRVSVDTVEPNRRILVRWPTPVEWTFTERADGTTFVVITSSGFCGTEDEQVAAALDSMGGFSFLLAGCKAFLEHGIALNLVPDHNPDGCVAQNGEPTAAPDAGRGR